MQELAFWSIVLILIVVGIRYGYQVYRKKIDPALSTWIIFFTATSLSFITYAAAESNDLKNGIYNAADIIGVLIIMLSIIFYGNKKIRFDSFEKYFLVSAGLIVTLWLLAKIIELKIVLSIFTTITELTNIELTSHHLSNFLTQALIVVGYIPTIVKLIKRKRNTESYFTWTGCLVAGLIALHLAIIGGNILSVVYIVRAIIMLSIVLSIMFFYTLKARKK